MKLANGRAGNKIQSHNSKFRVTSNYCNVVAPKKVSQEIKNESYDLIQNVQYKVKILKLFFTISAIVF